MFFAGFPKKVHDEKNADYGSRVAHVFVVRASLATKLVGAKVYHFPVNVRDTPRFRRSYFGETVKGRPLPDYTSFLTIPSLP